MKVYIPIKQLLFLIGLFSCTLFLHAEGVPDPSWERQMKFDYFYLEALRMKHNSRHTEAFQMLQHALSVDSTSSAAHYELSKYYIFLKQDSLALTALKKAAGYNPAIFEYRFALANQYREMARYAEAVVLFEDLVEEAPGNTELHFYLSELYIRLSAFEKAIQSLDRLENNIGMHESISLQKYKLYELIGESEKGLEEMMRLAAKFPQEARYQLILGDIYLLKKDPETALSYYDKALLLDPRNPYYVVSMLNYYQFKKDNEAMGKFFDEIMDNFSQDVELNRMYAQFLLTKGEIEKAKFHFQIVTEADPEDYESWRSLLAISFREDNQEEVIRISDAARIHFPEIPEFFFYKGIALYQLGNYSGALETFQEGVEFIAPENRQLLSSFYGQIGGAYHKTGEVEKAFEAYDTALNFNENNISVLNDYAYFLSLEKRDLERAERMSSKCVQLDPQNPTYIDTYAWVFFQRENYNLAKFYIEKAIANGGDISYEIIDHYGDILFKTGNIDRAVSEWKKALNMLDDEDPERSLLNRKIEEKKYYEK